MVKRRGPFYAKAARRVVTFAKPLAEKGVFKTRTACDCSLRYAANESAGEESVGSVQVGPQAHARARLDLYALLAEQYIARHGFEFRARGGEVVRDGLVFRFQDAAASIHAHAGKRGSPLSRHKVCLRELEIQVPRRERGFDVCGR